MKRLALTLVALAAVGLATSTAFAGGSHFSVSTGLVGHHGYQGRHYGHGYYGYGRSSVIVQPMVPGHPAVVYPVPGHPPVLHAPIHHGYRYYRYPYHRYRHGSHGGLHYYGKGFGISIGF